MAPVRDPVTCLGAPAINPFLRFKSHVPRLTIDIFRSGC